MSEWKRLAVVEGERQTKKNKKKLNLEGGTEGGDKSLSFLQLKQRSKRDNLERF